MYDRESGETEHESDIALCLEALASMDAQVVLVEKQAPASLVSALEQAGYATACIDVLSFGRADMGATGYFEAQLENANAIGEAFARQEEAS